jgi:hypothetical protein
LNTAFSISLLLAPSQFFVLGGGGGCRSTVVVWWCGIVLSAVSQALAVVVGAPKPGALTRLDALTPATHLDALPSSDLSKLKFKSTQRARERLKKESGF